MTLGFKHSAEARAKMSAKAKGRKKTPAHRAALSAAMTPARQAKISAARHAKQAAVITKVHQLNAQGGIGPTAIAKRLGVSRVNVYRILLRNDVTPRAVEQQPPVASTIEATVRIGTLPHQPVLTSDSAPQPPAAPAPAPAPPALPRPIPSIYAGMCIANGMPPGRDICGHPVAPSAHSAEPKVPSRGW